MARYTYTLPCTYIINKKVYSIVLMYSNIPIDRNLKAAIQHRQLLCAGPSDDFCQRSEVIGGVSVVTVAGDKIFDPRYNGRRGFHWAAAWREGWQNDSLRSAGAQLKRGYRLWGFPVFVTTSSSSSSSSSCRMWIEEPSSLWSSGTQRTRSTSPSSSSSSFSSSLVLLL